MNSVTLENFRCFGKKRTVRLAPLTLLVGENSTGKTSFLAAVRALWDLGYMHEMPNFRESPFDIGRFANIVHRSSENGAVAKYFEIGLDRIAGRARNEFAVKSSFRFADGNPDPVLVRWELMDGKTRALMSWTPSKPGRSVRTKVWTERGSWSLRGRRRAMGKTTNSTQDDADVRWANTLWDLRYALRGHTNSRARRRTLNVRDDGPRLNPRADGPAIRVSDIDSLERLTRQWTARSAARPFASSAVRSGPQRTYELGGVAVDATSAGVAELLASVASDQPDRWSAFRDAVERFGRGAGLFDDLEIKEVGEGLGLVRILVRASVGPAPGIWTDIADVGYGVGQVLPIIAQVLLSDGPRMFLLQQPEVHLHPVAQAEVGTFICQSASHLKQLIVETHSDYLLDRVRLDVRDGVGALKPEDVVILYFERRGGDVDIHEIEIDEAGNLVGQPEGYREFFRREFERVFLPADAALVE